MHLNKAILKCVSTDATRASIAHVYLDVEAKLALATDGHLLVAVPIDPEPGEVSGYVSADAILAAAKQKGKLKGQFLHNAAETRVGESWFLNPFQTDTTPPTFPEWRKLIPAYATDPGYIAFNSTLLNSAAPAIVSEDQKPIVTAVYDLANPIGVMVLKGAQPPTTDLYDRDWTTAFALAMPVRANIQPHTCAAITAQDETRALRETIATLEQQVAALTEECTALRQTETPETPASLVERLTAQYAEMERQYQALVAVHQQIQEDHDLLLHELVAVLQATGDSTDVNAT